jgi:hypothetical protein
MTTELEQEFFKVFGIEPTIYSLWDSKETQIKNFKSYEVYPEITDRILLKLICKACCLMFSIQGSSIELLKENILKEFIHWQEDVDKSEIQQLFKEGE